MFQRNNTTQKEYLEQENIIISTFQSCNSHTVFRLSYSLIFYGFSVSMQYKIIDLKLGKIVMDLWYQDFTRCGCILLVDVPLQQKRFSIRLNQLMRLTTKSIVLTIVVFAIVLRKIIIHNPFVHSRILNNPKTLSLVSSFYFQRI